MDEGEVGAVVGMVVGVVVVVVVVYTWVVDCLGIGSRMAWEAGLELEERVMTS